MQEPLRYTSDEGYTGILRNNSTLTITNPNGKIVFHTFFSAVTNYKELKRQVDTFPELIKTLTT